MQTCIAPHPDLFYLLSFFIRRLPLRSTLFPYTTLFRSLVAARPAAAQEPTIDWSHTAVAGGVALPGEGPAGATALRSEEHTSELQSHSDIVCRLLLEKKNLRPGPTWRSAV